VITMKLYVTIVLLAVLATGAHAQMAGHDARAQMAGHDAPAQMAPAQMVGHGAPVVPKKVTTERITAPLDSALKWMPTTSRHVPARGKCMKGSRVWSG